MYKLRLMNEGLDLAFITDVRQDPEVQENLGTFLLTNTQKQYEWYESIKNDSSKKYLIFEDEKSKYGYVRLTNIDYINRSICVGGDIAQAHREHGLSTPLYDQILSLCFNKMNMNRVYLFVLESNARAIHIYKKRGFTEEGRQRQAIYRDGKYLDYIMMSLLKEEYSEKEL